MSTLAEFTVLGLLVPQLTGDHRESVIAELSQQLENSGRIDNAGTFGMAVRKHEELSSAVLDGVAFPLARQGTVKDLSFAAGLLPQPISWGTPHGPSVHTIVLFAVPASEEKHYLPVALAFSKLLKNQITLATLRACVRPEEMMEVLEQIRF
jgi:mannitol/fructose-specific phosphotransferase system IIA component (Ntr-type)